MLLSTRQPLGYKLIMLAIALNSRYIGAKMDALRRQFIFVLGKGGVGKTTVALGLARLSALRGRKTLLAMTNAHERVSSMLDTAPIGTRIVSIEPNLDAVNMTPQAALEEYGMLILRARTVYRAVFENKLMQAFLHGTPGLEAWAMLGKAFYHADPPHGRPTYDLVVLDGHATGHALDMLRVPTVLHKVAPPGLLRREADRALQLFRDSQRAGAILVSLPEDMAVNETIELHTALSGELQIPTLGVIVNRVLPTLFSTGDLQKIETVQGAVPASNAASEVLQAARRRALREEIQRENKERLRSTLPVPYLELPDLIARPMDRTSLNSLQEILKEGFSKALKSTEAASRATGNLG